MITALFYRECGGGKMLRRGSRPAHRRPSSSRILLRGV